MWLDLRKMQTLSSNPIPLNLRIELVEGQQNSDADDLPYYSR